MSGKIKVGLDFDGVVAYNPFRVIRAPVSLVKKRLLGFRKLSFYYPRRKWEQIFWKILHESSIFPARGIDLLVDAIKRGTIEAHLITARYSFLDDHLYDWLDKYKIKRLFTSINLNKKDEQPHLFKERIIKQRTLDVYIEDNLDIVRHLHTRTKTKIYWIYNILDKHRFHPHKYPYLEKALEDIMKNI